MNEPSLFVRETPPEKATQLEASYKAREVEGFFDLHFYRKIGYRIALCCARLGVSPAQVTSCGALLGIVAGHLYYYPDLRLNAAGMFLHVLANAFDNADGQLARLTSKGSRTGRALDGLADYLVFLSVYVHLCLRYVTAGGSQLVWLLALAAALSHSVQSAVADYFRNAWLFFARGKSNAELDSSDALQEEYNRLRWNREPREKFLFRLHLNYTREQEWLAPRVTELERTASQMPDGALAEAYRFESAPLIKWQNLLATTPRMIVLFALLFVSQPTWYFVLEATVFNLVLVFLLRRQNELCRELVSRFDPAARRRIAAVGLI